jgi:hypothetical protein
VWTGYWPWGFDPETEIATKKYRHLKMEVTMTRTPSQPICTGSAMSFGVGQFTAEWDIEQWLLRRPVVTNADWCPIPTGAGNPYPNWATLWSYSDPSITGTLSEKYQVDSDDCGTQTTTDPYSAYGDPGFLAVNYPDDCETPAGNAYANAMLYDVAAAFSVAPSSTTIVSEEVLELVYDSGDLQVAVTLTLTQPYYLAELVADAEALLAQVNFGDTILIGPSDNYSSATISPTGTSIVNLTEYNLCNGSGVVQAFTAEASGVGVSLYHVCGETSALKYWDHTGCWVMKSRHALTAEQTACKSYGEITKSNTTDYNPSTTCQCISTGLTGTIDVGPEDFGLGVGRIAVEPCPECA